MIAYQYQGRLKLAVDTEATATTYTWTCLAVDAGASTRGVGLDMVLDSSGIAHIAHHDSTFSTLRYVKSSTAAATAIATGSSAFTGSLLTSAGTSVTSESSKASLGVTSAGVVYVSYFQAQFQALYLATKAAGSSTWSVEEIDGLPSSPGFTSGAGQYSALLMNSSSLPTIFYRSAENWMKYFSREML